MTACKDSLNGKKAVSATLAGVLAVGMVPAAAFAATDAQAADTQDEQGIELQAKTEAAQFANAKVLSATDVDNAAISGDLTKISFKANANKAQKPTIQQVEVTKVNGDKVVEQVTDASKYTQKIYKADADGKITKTEANEGDFKVAGKFFVKVTAKNGTFKGGELTVPFEIKAATIEGATLYQVGEKADDLSDTTFTYTGKALVNGDAEGNIAVALNGEKLTGAKVEFHKKGDKTTAGAAEVKDAGEYYAVVTKEGQSVEIPFTVEKLDLSKVSFDTLSQKKSAAVAPHVAGADDAGLVKVDGKAFAASKATESAAGYTADVAGLTVTQKNAGSFGNAGTYEFTVAGAKDDANVTGTGTVTVNVAETELEAANFFYGKKAISSVYAAGKETTVDHADGDADFIASKVVVYTDVANKTALDSSKYSVKIYDKDNKEVANANKAGKYTVKIVVSDPDNKYTGSYTFKLDVKEGAIDADGTAFVYDGTATQSVAKVYDGQNVLDKLAISVEDSEGNKLGADDYTVEVKKSTDGTDGNYTKDATEVTNAGWYQIQIKAEGYDLTASENTCKVHVLPVQVTPEVKGIYAGGEDTAYLPYTGDAITPAFKYAVLKADGTPKKDENGNQVYADLPTDVYTLTYVYKKKSTDSYASVAEMKEKGYYNVRLVVADTDKAKNYTFVANSSADATVNGQTSVATSFDVRVADERNYKDVAASDWFNDAVNKISTSDYGKLMSGYAGTKLFGPNDTMTRAQVAKVLGKAAGVIVANDPTDGVVDSTKSYQTPFLDVDGSAWYAGYVAWASDTGIVTGYQDGSDAFGPEDSITREQFCLMLQRFAAKYNLYEAADGSALAAMPDASGVSSWAKDAVAWAVDKGYIGKGGVVDAQGTITRGMAAQILVRFVDDNNLVSKVPLM